MWQYIAILLPMCMLAAAMMSCAKMEIAGGMVYQTNEEAESAGLMSYFSGHDGALAPGILEKEKEYYAASADKTAARLELAKARVTEAKIPEADRRMLLERLDSGLAWTDGLKKHIRDAPDKAAFDAIVSQSYTNWHAVKLLPSSAEGFAITDGIQDHIDWAKTKKPGNANLREAENLNMQAKAIFLWLLSLDEHADFTAAEQARLEAFKKASAAQDKLGQ